MYTKYWGLRESPFRGSLDPRFYFNSNSHEEALARLQFMVDHQRRLGLLLGPSGSGKSLVLEVFANQMRGQGRQVAIVRLLGLTNTEFLCHLAYELGEDPDTEASLSRLWRCVTDRLLTNRYQQLDTVLLLDDADEAQEEVLVSVARLAQTEPSPAARLTIAIVANEHRQAQLGQRLLELTELRIDLDTWSREDTAEYLSSTMSKVGRSELTFTDSAVERMQELTTGVPRRVRQLAELVLLAGAGQGLTNISEDTVLAVNQELNISAATAVLV